MSHTTQCYPLAQVHEWVGSIRPAPSATQAAAAQPVGFIQLYVHDYNIAQEVQRSGSSAHGLNPSLIMQLRNMLKQCNPYVAHFTSAHERVGADTPEAVLVFRKPEADNWLQRHQYAIPQTSQIAAFTVTNSDDVLPSDVVVYVNNHGTGMSGLRRVSHLHLSAHPLLWPLLFPNGDAGFAPRTYLLGAAQRASTTQRQAQQEALTAATDAGAGTASADAAGSAAGKHEYVSARELMAYRMQVSTHTRTHTYTHAPTTLGPAPS